MGELRQILAPLETRVIGVTPVLSNRGEEIISWLAEHPSGNKYLVIDDEVSEIRPYIDDDHIVHVKNGFNGKGFGQEHLDRAEQLITLWSAQSEL